MCYIYDNDQDLMLSKKKLLFEQKDTFYSLFYLYKYNNVI